MEIMEIKGPRSLRGLTVFNQLMVSVKVLLPEFWALEYEQYFELMQNKSLDEKSVYLKRAILLNEGIKEDDIIAMLSFVKDSNNIPYSAASIKSLSPAQIVEMIHAVGMKYAEMEISMLSESEKKN